MYANAWLAKIVEKERVMKKLVLPLVLLLKPKLLHI